MEGLAQRLTKRFENEIATHLTLGRAGTGINPMTDDEVEDFLQTHASRIQHSVAKMMEELSPQALASPSQENIREFLYRWFDPFRIIPYD